MAYKINSYFAILIVTIFGAGATMTIIHVANSTMLATTIYGNEASGASVR